MPMTTKLGWVVTYYQGLPPMKPHNTLITWSCKIMRQTKTIISPLPYWLWPPNLAGWWLTVRGSHPFSYMALLAHGLVRSWDKLRPLYLHYHIGYGHQTWQGGDLLWGVPTHSVTWPYWHMVLWDHVRN